MAIERVILLGGGSPGGDQGLPDAGERVRETLPQSLGMAGRVRFGYLLSQLLALTDGEGGKWRTREKITFQRKPSHRLLCVKGSI